MLSVGARFTARRKLALPCRCRIARTRDVSRCAAAALHTAAYPSLSPGKRLVGSYVIKTGRSKRVSPFERERHTTKQLPSGDHERLTQGDKDFLTICPFLFQLERAVRSSGKTLFPLTVEELNNLKYRKGYLF